MSETKNNFVHVSPQELVRETYIEKSALFGFIRWNQIAKRETIGNQLVIAIAKIPEKVFINGTEYLPKA